MSVGQLDRRYMEEELLPNQEQERKDWSTFFQIVGATDVSITIEVEFLAAYRAAKWRLSK